jgi:hypothetical protein
MIDGANQLVHNTKSPFGRAVLHDSPAVFPDFLVSDSKAENYSF